MYDTHTLFVSSGTATKEQVEQVFRSALTAYETRTKTRIQCKFLVKLLQDYQRRPTGTAIVFVSNPSVYFMILGKNPDGTERYCNTNNPLYKKLINEIETIKSKLENLNPSTLTWGEFMNKEEEYNEMLEEKIKTYKAITNSSLTLEPLIKLPPCKIITSCEIKYINFEVSRAVILPVKNKVHNVLECLSIPTWITKQDLKEKFSIFATDSKTLQLRKVKGKIIKEPYPFVDIINSTAIVTFDPKTHDAEFALYFMNEFTIKKKVNGNKKTATLYFDLYSKQNKGI
ncbi:MAG: hypothetical protein QXV60_03170 [Nitrososphaerota archaeon]